MSSENEAMFQHLRNHFNDYTYDMFMMNMSMEPEEMDLFSEWLDVANSEKLNGFEAVHLGKQSTEIDVVRQTGEALTLLNFSSYNYLGFSNHPEVIQGAKDALDQYGLGASSSPVISGTNRVHQQLEEALLKFFDLPDHGVSLFTSGYSVNLGAIQAFAKTGSHIILDQSAHMSLLEGAKLSGAEISYFKHNDTEELAAILGRVSDDFTRVLICVEGVYSGDGDYGKLKEIVQLAKQHGAYTLVDEAHSALIAGEHGRGVCEAQGVLEDVDLYVMTFSKAFGGVGGALLARKAITRYVNWYAKCRMFSCALDPAVTGGMVKVVELAGSEEGNIRRKRIKENADYLNSLLRGKVDLGKSETWIVTVVYGHDKKTLALSNYLQQQGLDTSILQFPAVPKNEGRIRLFVSSEHTQAQLERAAEILLDAAKRFGFAIEESHT